MFWMLLDVRVSMSKQFCHEVTNCKQAFWKKAQHKYLLKVEQAYSVTLIADFEQVLLAVKFLLL